MMKRFTLSIFMAALFMLPGSFLLAQVEKLDAQKETSIAPLKHISEYKNLQFDKEDRKLLSTDIPLPGNDIDTKSDPRSVNKDQQLKSGNTTCNNYWAGNLAYGYPSNWGDISVSPYINFWGYYYYGYYAYMYYNTTFTFAQPAKSVTIDVWYSGYLYAYDTDGNYLGYASRNGYWWGAFTYTAPEGKEIGYIVTGGAYTRYMTVCYQSNQEPVALAQNLSFDADDNCQAFASAADFDNGSYDPDGDALSFSVSPAGPYAVGTTNVTLTVSDGELSSSASATVTVTDNTVPSLEAPLALELENDLGFCGAAFTLTVPEASDNCGIASVTSDAPGFFPVGTTTVTWVATDVHGNTAQVTQDVLVADTEAPELNVTSDVITLWPVNHKYETVYLSDLLESVSDNCSINDNGVFIKSVSSDEAEDAKGGGDGNTKNDIVILDGCTAVDLRSERAGNSNGRVYTIELSVSDESGNETTALCYVQVPPSKKGTAVDDGAASGYTVESGCGGKSGFNTFDNTLVAAQKISMQAYPNPFSHSTEIVFQLAEESATQLHIYSATGHLVKTMVDQRMTEGQHRIVWDGTNNAGASLSTGMYFIVLNTSNGIARSSIIINR